MPRRRIDLKKSLLLAAAFILFLIIFVNAVRYITYLGLDMTRAEQMEISTSVPCEVAIIRTETLITAPTVGEFVPAVTEGTKVHNGTVIGNMNFENSSAAVSATRSGLVFFDTDGWENVLTPDTMNSLDWASTFAALSQDKQAATSSETVADDQAAGRNVARLMENLAAPYICVHVEGDVTEYVQDENKLYLRFEELGDEVIKTKFQQNEDGEYDIRPADHYYVLRMITDNSMFNTFRYGPAELLGESKSGIAVPVTAVTKSKDGKTGVYISNKKKLIFREVEVQYKNEEFAIVDGINVTDDVAADPRHARVGKKIY